MSASEAVLSATHAVSAAMEDRGNLEIKVPVPKVPVQGLVGTPDLLQQYNT